MKYTIYFEEIPIYLGKLKKDINLRPSPVDDGFYGGIIPFYGRTIQVSEIF